ncbi:MAG TPA: hypothetical protein VNX88_10650 [Terriglobales bacterium]|jgi:hypothetical protein|nr:hypothetical protein [Terriglobales bacterium]
MLVARISCLALIVTVHGVIAQTISRAYIGDDGKVHLVFADGAVKVLPSEPQQVGCENISISEDKLTVGWSVLVKNCCTSYPIPISVAVYTRGKKTIISPGQMIYEWHFVDNHRLAVLFGPVHGWASGANLYNIHGGKIVESWNGKGDAPEWANRWEEQFDH